MSGKYLLSVSDTYYPGSGDSDWIGTFETIEDADEQGAKLIEGYRDKYYSVIDLERWINDPRFYSTSDTGA